MNRNETEERIILFYEHMRGGVTNYPEYTLHELSDIDRKALDNFFIWSEENGVKLTEEFLANFMVFAFYWYIYIREIEVVNKHGARSIQLSWIIGRTMLAKWAKFVARHPLNYISMVQNDRQRFVKDYHMDFTEVNKWFYTPKPSEKVQLVPHEEKAKKLYYNTDAGLAYCQERTYLYNHMSELCTECKFQKACKEELKKEYPKLYIARGYGQAAE